MQRTVPLNEKFRIYYLNEQAITLEFGQKIDPEILNSIRKFNKLIHQQPFPGFRTTVPAYTTLSVFFDPVRVFENADLPGNSCFDKVSAYLGQLETSKTDEDFYAVKTVSVPVCYGGKFGPDLEEVAGCHQLSIAEVIRLHTAAIYEVCMIGFVPGFAYLGGLPEVLATPRKASPRKAVPAGSVGIAGLQTGIYPLETPGGWQIIGQTPLRLFDAARAQPSLLKAGDRVVFKPIDSIEFQSRREF